MKRRTNVILDMELLQKAQAATGERTYSGAITRALEEVVRRNEFRIAVLDLQQEAAKGDLWDREYVAARWPEVAEKLWPRQRVADKAQRR